MNIGLMNVDPYGVVLCARNERWDAARLAQCFMDMPVQVAQCLLDAKEFDCEPDQQGGWMFTWKEPNETV